jgi:hypothetical protein
MTAPEQLLTPRRRRQILDDETMERLELGTPREDAWVSEFISRLAGVIRSLGRKRKKLWPQRKP